MSMNLPEIHTREQRDRWAAARKTMLQQANRMAEDGPAPRQEKAHHRAIIRSARADAKTIMAAIRHFDTQQRELRAKAKR